jgi:RNA methyltransferase, TrmH family
VTTALKGDFSRMRRIEGRHNALVKELRQSFSKSEPNEDGFCSIEGLRILEEALRSGVRFKAVFFSESALSRAQRLLPQIGSHTETLLLPDKLFAAAVPSGAPQGVAALAKWKAFTIEDLLTRANTGPLLALAGVQDPGNVGTILRSAEAFGAAGVIVGEGTVSVVNPKVVRASAGSVFRVPVVQARLADLITKLKEHGTRLVATSSHKGSALPESTLDSRIAVFVGGEGAGISRDLLAEMDEIVVIPHSERVESLNAGVAASIVLYEIARRK